MRLPVQAVLFAVLRLAGVAAVGLLAGWPFGHPSAGIALAALGYLFVQLVNLYRLDWWTRHRSLADAPDLDGTWGGVIAQIVRLHRRKRYHKHRFVQLLRQIQHSTAALPDGVVILDAEFEIRWFNRMAAQLLGLRRPADLGLRVDHLVRQPEFGDYLARGEYSNPVVIRHGPAEAHFLSLQIVPYGEGQRLLLVRDVSAQMRLEAMRKDFVANASHELRSPLTVISGYLETLSLDPALEPDVRGPIAEMRRQADRMTAIIRDLLELSRLESTEGEAARRPIDAGALLEALRRDILTRAERPHEVRVRVDSDAPLLGVPSEIHSAFFNLLDNAAKYTPCEGSIEMRWWVGDDGGHFAVKDTGIGIQPEHIPRLTERFYRVDPGRSRASGGSGLGLAIVKHVLQRHEAALEIESVPGEGSTFACRFPPDRIGARLPARTADVPL